MLHINKPFRVEFDHQKKMSDIKFAESVFQRLVEHGRIPGKCQQITTCSLYVEVLDADGVPLSMVVVHGIAFCSPKDRPIDLYGQAKSLERALEAYVSVTGNEAPTELYQTVTEWYGKCGVIQENIKATEAAREAAREKAKRIRQERHQAWLVERERREEEEREKIADLVVLKIMESENG